MNTFKQLLDSLMVTICSDVENIAAQQAPLVMPKVASDQVIKLCQQAQHIFQNEPTMLELKAPCIIVGDIHGHILDLFRILRKCGFPPYKKYIFLGDLVDRGEFSTETVIIIFLLKVCYPENVFIIRGNHEFNFLCQQCGFFSEVIDIYDEPSVYNSILTAFSYMPLAARIENKVLCVHGGIGPNIHSLNAFKTIVRPLCDFGHDDTIDAILWSDPNDEIEEFTPSSRGTGYFYGGKAIDTFVKECNLDLVIRGHECVNDGVEIKFNGQLMTVFSASNYCGLVGNNAAVVEFKVNNNSNNNNNNNNNNNDNINTATYTYEIKKFPPLEYYRRSMAIFGQRDSANSGNGGNNTGSGGSSSRKLTKKLTTAYSHKVVPLLLVKEPPPITQPQSTGGASIVASSAMLRKAVDATCSLKHIPNLRVNNTKPGYSAAVSAGAVSAQAAAGGEKLPFLTPRFNACGEPQSNLGPNTTRQSSHRRCRSWF